MLMLKWLLILVTLCLLQKGIVAKIKIVKYVYQKDMSEHCRRRVMPSVFLGRNVVEANSKILHFSQLEVPYSCFISIRTETGGNMILVIQTDSQPSIFCAKDRTTESPVKVFAMGETFGGYWGPLPDSLLSTGTPLVEKFYTLKTTKVDNEDSDRETNNNEENQNEQSEGEEGLSESEDATKKAVLPKKTEDTNDYIREMIPIVNITGRLVKSDKEPVRAFAADDTFDLFYNVQREPGQKYDSTVMPLMQFSVGTELSGRRGMGDAAGNETTPEPRFDFEYDFGAFTLDPRLMFSLSDGKSNVAGKRYRPYVNKLLDFKKHKGKLFSEHGSTKLRDHQVQENKFNESWSYIEGLLANLTKDDSEQTEREKQLESKRFLDLMQRVADWQHNYSAYLSPNLTLKDPLFLEKMQKKMSTVSLKPSAEMCTSSHESNINTTVKKFCTEPSILTKEISAMDSHLKTESSTRLIKISPGTRKPLTSSESYESANISTLQGVTSTITNKVIEIGNNTVTKITNFATAITKRIQELGNKIPSEIVSTKTSKDSIDQSTITTRASTKLQTEKTTAEEPSIKSSITQQTMTGSMADRASWENVVQVAPKIADILTTTKSFENAKSSSKRRRRRRRRRRKKRSIQAIPIEPARPHNLTTDPDVITTPEPMYNFEDLQDFAMLVELPDDEIQGHMALRYMRRYVGPTLFDLCTGPEHSTQHVLFFNTSRIVLALTNFTLKRMTVIATPARWLTLSGQRCDTNSLECQVAGKRCCVNKLIACDGVPNCGAMDIYDEDRLLCGADNSLQHNVYLSAFTFLAVLLTLLYTVHYWLKRCVPKVSDAFFIYTDGTENILYLDSIMRSPLENEGFSGKAVYHGDLYEDILITGEQAEPEKKGFFKRIIQCFRRKKSKYNDFAMVDLDLMDGFHPQKHTFSFAEIEINKLTEPVAIEVAVQTGASLEMQSRINSNDICSTQYRHLRQESIDPRAGFRDIRLNYETDEEETDRRTSEDSELNMLKFLRQQAKNAAEQWNRNQETEPVLEKEDSLRETEQKNMLYDRSLQTMQSDHSTESANLYQRETFKEISKKAFDIPFGVQEQSVDAPGPSTKPVASIKRIRFNEHLTTVSQEQEENNATPVSGQASATDLEEAPSSSTRDFRRFWTNKKGKKEKQKQRTHLPIH